MSTPTPTTQGATQGAGNNVTNNPAFWNFLGSVATAAGNIAATAIGSGSQQSQQGPASASGLAPVQMTAPGNTLLSEIRPFLPIILAGVGVLLLLLLVKNIKK